MTPNTFQILSSARRVCKRSVIAVLAQRDRRENAMQAIGAQWERREIAENATRVPRERRHSLTRTPTNAVERRGCSVRPCYCVFKRTQAFVLCMRQKDRRRSPLYAIPALRSHCSYLDVVHS